MWTRRLVGFFAAVLALFALLGLSGCTTQMRDVAAQHPAIPTGKTCAECHAKDKTHLPPYNGACGRCHGLVSWKAVVYKHKDTAFDLGPHGVVGCIRCHEEGAPPPSPECRFCHLQRPHGGWTTCRQCHTPVTWLIHRPPPSGHLPLLGKHAQLKCLDCHDQNQLPTYTRTCVNCHGTRHGGLRDCARCHDPSRGWEPKFDHNTVFVLSGIHAKLDCGKCHPERRYFFATATRCADCHGGSRHGGLTRCASCHTTDAFVPTTFRHSRVFRLSGGPHARLACTRCHPSRRFAHVRGRTCEGCHGRVHGVTSCGACHTSAGNVARGWDHTVFFRLVGAHASLACSACHGSPHRAAAGTLCVDCHGARHGGVTFCGSCHSTSSFTPIIAVPHPSSVPLAGRHGSLTGCSECHRSPPDFVATPRSCQECHSGDVPHVGPTDCARCHYPVASWATTHFTHPSVAPHTSTEFGCDFCHEHHDFTAARSAICVICHPVFPTP